VKDIIPGVEIFINSIDTRLDPTRLKFQKAELKSKKVDILKLDDAVMDQE